jgi:eukaryotic-like serine/threonine-protein kinase
MLDVGARVGPFEVLSLVGAGGMGEVYRARDPRLGRDVALKVLPVPIASDADRLRRFELEAKAVGALNHPNVLAVYDVGTEGGRPYVVTELLEGDTLRTRLGGVALPLRKALDYAGQIARGLAAAHEKGIVHRDLKPENLFVTKDGRIKILDFGLAKLTRPEDPSSTLQTLSQGEPGTSPGMILGTVGYMSPEQARGLAADPRADIFAFGAILYEMLSGQRAFRGETTADTLHAILRQEPAQLSGVSPGLERVVRHCLEKSPDERFQSARDLAFNLDALSEASGVGPALPEAQGGRRRTQRRLWALGGGSLLVTAAAALLVGRLTSQAPSPPSFQRMTFQQGRVTAARFASDGETVVYSASWQERPTEVFLAHAGSHESRPLGLPDAGLLSLSSANEMALLLKPRSLTLNVEIGTLARAPVAGGAPRELLEDVQDADWSPDGKDLAIIRWAGDKCSVEYPLGHVVYAPAPPSWVSHLRVSPQGDRIAFVEHPLARDLRGGVGMVDRAGKRQTLAQGFKVLQGLAWSSRGDEVWFSTVEGQATFYAISLSGRQRLVAHAPTDTHLLDISRGGGVLLRSNRMSVHILAVGRDGGRERDVSELESTWAIDLSRDGRTLLGEDDSHSFQESIFLKRTDGTPAVWLGEGTPLALSPDGKQILAKDARTSPHKLMLVPAGAGQPLELPRGNVVEYLQGKWFPDGRKILLAASEGAGHDARLYVQDIAGGAPRTISPEGFQLQPLGPSISPDGHRAVAIASDFSPVLYPLEGGEPKAVPGLAPGDLPIGWTEDGTGVFFYKVDEPAATVFRADLTTGRTQAVRELSASPPRGMVGDYRILTTPDARSFVYSYIHDVSDLFYAEGLR